MKVSGSATDIEATQTLPKNQRAPRGLSEQLGESSIRIVGTRLRAGVMIDRTMLSQDRKTRNIMGLGSACLTVGQPPKPLQGAHARLEFRGRSGVEAEV